MSSYLLNSRNYDESHKRHAKHVTLVSLTMDRNTLNFCCTIAFSIIRRRSFPIPYALVHKFI